MPSHTQSIPNGIACAICSAIAASTEQGPILPRLIHGDPKVIITFWCEPGDNEDRYIPSRGDGATTLVFPGDDLYQLPADNNPGCTNIRQAVPFWLVQSHGAFSDSDSICRTRAYGLIHPVYNMAVVDYYDADGNFVTRRAIMDQRLSETESKSRTEELQGIYIALSEIQAWRENVIEKAPPIQLAGKDINPTAIAVSGSDIQKRR